MYEISFETDHQNLSSGTCAILNDLNLNSTASQDRDNVQHYVDDSPRNHNYFSTQSSGINLQTYEQNSYQGFENDSKRSPYNIDSFAQTSKQSQNDFQYNLSIFLMGNSNIDCKQNDFDLESMNNKNKLDNQLENKLQQNQRKSKSNKEVVKFGLSLFVKNSDEYKKMRNGNNIAVKKCREKKKILEKEIQVKLDELDDNIKTLESLHEKMVNTYPNEIDQFAILNQKLIKLKEQADKLANDTNY